MFVDRISNLLILCIIIIVGIHRFKLTNAAQPNGFLKVDEVQEFDSSAEVIYSNC